MTEWMPFNNGLPNVIIKELEIHYDKGTISAATFGRGIWESPLNALSSVNTNNIENLNVSIYPNPAEDEIIINATVGHINICIFSITGKKVVETTSKVINISNLAKGYYIVEIKSTDLIKRNKLIIK